VSTSGDDRGMSDKRALSDRAVERLLAGRPVDDEPLLSAFVASVAACTPAEAPRPSPALAALLEAGLPVSRPAAAPTPSGVPAVTRRARHWARGALVWRSLALGGALSVSAVMAGAVAGALPAPAQDGVADLVRWVTPLELPRSDDRGRPGPSGDPASADVQPTVAPTHSGVPAPDPSPTVSPRATDRPAPGTTDPSTQPEPRTTATPDDTETLEPDVDETEEPVEEPTEEPTEEPVEEDPTEEPAEEEQEASGLLPIRLP